MIMRVLERNEIETIWTIDRSEAHYHVYRLENGELRLTPAYFDMKGWAPGQVETDTPLLYACFDRGGAFWGMFDEDRLVGVAVVDSVPRGIDSDRLQLEYLYVSCDYRGQGVGTRLFNAAKEFARASGARYLYISATPTENTINFYLGRGCRVAAPPDPDLFLIEPDDIHLICPTNQS